MEFTFTGRVASKAAVVYQSPLVLLVAKGAGRHWGCHRWAVEQCPGLKPVPVLVTVKGGLSWSGCGRLGVEEEGGGIEQGPGFGGGDGRVIREVSWGRKSGLFPVCCSAFVALLFCSAQNWSGRFRSRVPSRQTWRRTPGSRSRTSSCPQSGRVSQPGGRVTQRMTNSCDCIKIDTVRLQPVFPPRALETLIKISLSPRRVVFQDSHLSRKF